MKNKCLYCNEVSNHSICQKCYKYSLTKEDTQKIKLSMIDKNEKKILEDQFHELENLIQESI